MAALRYAAAHTGVEVFNLGTGAGYSVLDMVHAFSRACGKEIPYRIAPRRSGDVAACYADVSKAKEVLGWNAQLGIETCAAARGIGSAAIPTDMKSEGAVCPHFIISYSFISSMRSLASLTEPAALL